MLLTNFDDDVPQNTFSVSNNTTNKALDDINDDVDVDDDSATMSLKSTTTTTTTGEEPFKNANENICLEFAKHVKCNFPIAAEHHTTFLSTAQRKNEFVEPVSISTLKARLRISSMQQSSMEKYRTYDYSNTNSRPETFPCKFWKNSMLFLFPVKEIDKIQTNETLRLLGKPICRFPYVDRNTEREGKKFPYVDLKSINTFPVVDEPQQYSAVNYVGMQKSNLFRSPSKCLLCNKKTLLPNNSSDDETRNFPICNQQQSKNIAHFPCPETENILNSLTDLNQNNPAAANSQKQTTVQVNAEYSEYSAIDDNESSSSRPAAIMTLSSNSPKYVNGQIIQVHHTKKHSTNGQSNNGTESELAESHKDQPEQQEQNFTNDAAVLPTLNAKNTCPEQQCYKTEYHNFNNILATRDESLLSAPPNIKNVQLVSILKSTITPTIGENLENFKYEEQQSQQHSSNNNDQLDNHHDHQTDRQCSDERDTSSQEVLVKKIPTETSEKCPLKSFFALNTTHQYQQQKTCCSSPPTAPILNISQKFESVPLTPRVKSNGCNCTEVDILTCDIINNRQVQVVNERPYEQPEVEISEIENSLPDCEHVEMTVTKNKGENSEESVSILSDNQKIVINEKIDEMKFEMKSVKGALQSSVPVHNRLHNEQNVPSVAVGLRSNPSTVTSAASYVSSAYKSLDMPRLVKASSAEVSTSLRAHEAAVGTRTASVDTVDSLLPTRTRLRRQRRMLSQDSSVDDQTEDPIERLNRLRARISGALTEVKGVLNKYSTETESTEEPKSSLKSTSLSSTKRAELPPVKDEEPVKFRFVRKVRRRSLFDEGDEDKEKQSDVAKVNHETENVNVQVKTEKETEKLQVDTVKLDLKTDKTKDEVLNVKTKTEIDVAINSSLNSIEIVKNVDLIQVHESNIKSDAESQRTDKSVKESTLIDPKSISITDNEVTTSKTNRELLNPIDEELENQLTRNHKKLDVEIEEKSSVLSDRPKILEKGIKLVPKSVENSVDETENMPISTDTELNFEEILNKKDDGTTGTVKKLQRKVKGQSIRRASIAAVEGSKIEPPVKSALPLIVKAQRRPSDSEAVVKKKVSNDDLDGVAAKVKVKTITRVKRPSVKSDATSVAAVNATIKRQVNSKAASITAAAMATSLIVKRDDNDDGDTITEANNSNKDTVPISATTTSSETTKTATPPAALLPTQLVIDDASLTIPKTTTAEKAAPPKDEKPKSYQTTTKLNEQNGAPMGATLVSSLRASEQNGAEVTNAKQLVELVGETVIVTPFTALDKPNKTDNLSKACSKISEQDSDEVVTDTRFESTEISSSVQEAPVDDIKKRINQKIITTDVLQVQLTNQQVVATVADTALAAVVGVPPIQIAKSEAIATDESSPSSSSCYIDISTKASDTPTTSNSTEQTTATTTTRKQQQQQQQQQQQEEEIAPAESTMPELQLQQMPVKAVQIFGDHQTKDPAPFNVLHKDEFAKKKIVLKKLVRKNSTEKPQVNSKSNDESNTVPTTKDKSKTQIPHDIQLKTNDNAKTEDTVENDAALTTDINDKESEAEEAEAVVVIEAPPKKPRTVKKKVIIKRQQRKLSIGDTFFNAPEVTNQKEPPPEVETVERAIAYVTDDEEDDSDELLEPPKPLKPCIKLREYQIGDWVMYAERFKKTQVRWKKGRVLERITSISYKLDIDGKEVPAHISYIKKYTDRKVNFGGKEYLEIDYEQIAIEEQKARSYSIWNMV